MKHQYISMGAVFWLLLVLFSAIWNLYQIQLAQEQMHVAIARSFFELIVTVREWNAQHGGVYVPVSETLQPNPYLHDPKRDIVLADGTILTKVNPAFMTRLISQLAEEGNDLRFHITSRQPINPNNVADTWEEKALAAFEENGQKEAYTWDVTTQTFRYMAPLITQESCLTCHATHGYSVGDIRGGISVSFQTQPIMIWPVVSSHTLIALVGIVAINIFGRKLLSAFNNLERLSQIDGLTQIHNRSFFDIYFSREFLRTRRQNAPLSIALCDVDYFKSFNDIYGHQAGDTCLRHIAKALTATVKRPGDLVARYGGEEFVIVLPETNADGALVIADMVRANIEALNISHKGSEISDHITLSVGIATYNGETKATTLIEMADRALYAAKQAGRNMIMSSAA